LNPKTIAVKPRSGRLQDKASRGSRIPQATLDNLEQIFRMLGDASRLRILLTLAHEGELNVTDLKGLLDRAQPRGKKLSQPAISHHLGLLRLHHLVENRRAGKNNFYRIASARLRGVLDQFFAETGNGHKELEFGSFSLAYKANGKRR
jgi:DNA-binding transcriptional ArsR family regulator